MTKPKYYKASSTNVTTPECKNSTYKLCGDPDTSIDIGQVWCIPKEKTCPLTSIKFNALGTALETSKLSKDGEPLVDVQMS